MSKIVIITSSQPSVNPRMVKEADALAQAGHDVVVVYQYWDEWASKSDSHILKDKQWKAIRVGGSPKVQKLLYFATRLIHKFGRIAANSLSLNYGLAEWAIGRCGYFLYREAIKHEADIYIGHNPGGLAPTVRAAKKKRAKCGFDAEDFHRNERSDDPNHPDVKLKSFLENKYFPQLDYLVSSSPQISGLYSKLFNREVHTILNVFPREDRYVNKIKFPSPLKLLWFSQKIGPDRGIQDVFRAMKLIENHSIEFHILGKPRPDIIEQFNALVSSLQFNTAPIITYHEPIPSNALTKFVSKFDIGLALEPGFCLNNTVALSNKLFTYMNAGLAIIATETTAQKHFLDANPEIGKTYPKGDFSALAGLIKYYLEQPADLLNAKSSAYLKSETVYNWESESIKLLKIVEETIAL